MTGSGYKQIGGYHSPASRRRVLAELSDPGAPRGSVFGPSGAKLAEYARKHRGLARPRIRTFSATLSLAGGGMATIPKFLHRFGSQFDAFMLKCQIAQ